MAVHGKTAQEIEAERAAAADERYRRVLAHPSYQAMCREHVEAGYTGPWVYSLMGQRR